ncbi:MAG: polysaccharide biosynthesis/export family protein [Pirellulaceae bacterium]
MPVRWDTLVTSCALCAACLLTGCQAITFKIKGTAARTLPQECRATPKRGLVPIDITQLTQRPPEEYLLAPGDVIGIYIPGIIPYSDPAADPVAPPIHYPDPSSELPPAVGIPYVVLANGKITLPAIQPITVEGLTVEELTEAIRQAYVERKILKDNNTIPLVTLFRPRSYSITVVREDTGSEGLADNTARGATVNLPAYKNDVLHALMATGGLPGLRAKNEVKIYRNAAPGVELEELGVVVDVTDFNPAGAGPANYAVSHLGLVDGPETVIPLRIYEGQQLTLNPQDVILNEGDIVYISNRDTEVFYTSGLLPGGEHLLPRDYDIDIFEAMSIAGYSYGQPSSGGGGGGLGGLGASTGVAATQLFIFRERPDGSEYTIEVDLEQAIAYDAERLLVKPGDKLYLRYSPCEETLNFGIASFFTYGIRQLFRN